MNNLPPYLRVGPVAIHIRSRDTQYEHASPSNDYSVTEPTLGVQGSVFLSPDDGTSIEELNGVVSSNAFDSSSSTFTSPVPSSLPPPSPVASIPSPSVSFSVVNADHSSVQNPIPSSSISVQEPNAQWSSSPGPQASPTQTPLSTFPQETKGYSSSTPRIAPSSVLVSPQSSGVNPQPTVLAGSTTTALSDPSLVESMTVTSTNSLGPASPTVASENSATNRNTTVIIVGSILAAILGVVLILTVVAWFLRIRSRRRSEDEPSWDPEPNTGHNYDSDNFFESPPFQVGQDRITPPVRPLPPGPTTMSQPDSVEPQTMQAPYSHLATPELAHTTGPLTVTNLMPGDIPLSTNTSIFMRSRPGSAQVTPRIDNYAPRFTRIQDGGLSVPWSHSTPETSRGPVSRPKAWPSRLSAASLKKAFSSSPSKSTQIDPLQPRTSTVNMKSHFNNTGTSNIQFPEPARTTDQTWSGTIRSGITNALSAVIGTAVRPESPDSYLTPILPRPNRRLSSKTGTSTLDSMSTASTRSMGTDYYTLEEKSEGRGIVHICPLGRPHDTPSSIKEEETEDESETDTLPLPGSSTLKDVHANKPVIEQAQVPEIPRVPDDVVGRPSSVPRLPTIRPLSRGWTLRSEGYITLPESDDGYRSAFNQMLNERKQEYGRRLAELEVVAAEEASRPVMSRASTTSIFTESTALSRESSVMDDDERRAKKVLRMRRKRAMALSSVGVGNGKRG